MCPALSKAFDISNATEMPKSKGSTVREKKKKIVSRVFHPYAILAIRYKIRRVEIFINLPVEDILKNFVNIEG